MTFANSHPLPHVTPANAGMALRKNEAFQPSPNSPESNA